MPLLGRERECHVIDGVLARARAGESAALVLRGEPGIGKTAVLRYAAGAAGEALVLRARGIESEVDIAFGGLHALLRPAVEALDRLPGPQAAALRGALGLAAAGAGERHLVGAATLGLLGVLSEERPVVVLVDDFQWLDGPSGGAIVFAARRLLADAVAVVVAARSGEPSAVDGAGLPELELAGLAAEPARALLAAHAARPVAGDTAAWLHSATGGNPLALVELAQEAPRLRPSPIGADVPVGHRIARAFGRRLEGLSAAARATVLAVAVADAEELEPALAAAVALGGSITALEEAEAARLLTVEAGRVRFEHPLVRSAVLAGASPSDRRAAHRAYADALGSSGDSEERRAWHAAAGTVAASAPVAAALAAAGARAAGRGGYASASSAFQQAARLTPDQTLRAERLRAASEAAWLAGQAPRALHLLDEAEPLTAGWRAQAAAAHLRGRVLARHGPIPAAVRVLRDAAALVEEDDPAGASEILAEATYAAIYGGAAEDLEAMARRAAALAPRDHTRALCLAASALGAALVLLARPDATARLQEASALIERAPALRDDVRLAAWLGIPALFLRGAAGDYAPLRRAIAAAREDGAIGVLPFVLFEAGASSLATAGWDDAGAAFAEAMRLAGEAGLRVDLVSAQAGLARLEARRGAPSAAEHAARAVAGAQELGVPLFEAWGRHAEGELAWARDDVEAAIAAFEAKAAVTARHGMLDADLSPAPELVEAYLRVGRRDDARRLAAEAVAEAEAKGRPWARARAARAQAVAEPDDDAAVAGLAAAVALHGETADAFELARTRLCLGERLRRAGRRADARPVLRAALAGFEDLRAAPWAERAAAELKATGERVRRRGPSSLDELTAQELRIAMMLADGATTRQAAAALYLSPKTVEYHLRHVYLKLGVNSRTALAAALRRGDPGGAAAPEAPVSATAG